ncbi:hypothetical protein P280DRAFT_154926 [Massarina eburnea CBS 473.64]|uniref:Uncharacterized protein n=1 Tax=Massarina eburnea CBS 473.64 TaxID=1395130 RepID=A0A6A6RLQ7_9PLEO|nr:hypothetical protein P280DRAFT_154926 [Massarina eburnea CBS 473.64]
MQYYLAVFVATLALASAVPAGTDKINPNGLQPKPTVIGGEEYQLYEPQSEFTTVGAAPDGNSITMAKSIGKVSDANSTGEVSAAVAVCPQCVAIVYAEPNFNGPAWGILPLDMQAMPDQGHCTTVPANTISSISFVKENKGFRYRAVCCYIYANANCGRSGESQKNWVGTDVKNMRDLGWDNRMGSINCYFKGDENTLW